MDNRNTKKEGFEITSTMIIHWYVRTITESIRFDNFISALEFFNRQESAIIFPIEEVTHK